MSTYELNDDEAIVIAGVLRSRNTQQATELAKRIEAQIPIPVPVKIGAVVRTARAGDYLRWAYDTQTVEPWIEVRDPNLKTYRTGDLGLITEVLSLGVDL